MMRSSFHIVVAAASVVLCTSTALSVTEALYVSNGGDGTIRQISLTGESVIYASGLPTPRGLAFDSMDNLYVACAGNNTIYKIAPGGVKSVYYENVRNLYGLAVGPQGEIYVVNSSSGSLGSVVRINPDRTGGPIAAMPSGGGIVHLGGSLYITHSINPGGGMYHYNFIDPPIEFATDLADPIGLTVGPDGLLYTAEFVEPARVMRVSTSGVIEVVSDDPALGLPYGLAFDSSGVLYVADFDGGKINIVATDGSVTPWVSGLASPRFLVVGPAIAIPETLSLTWIGAASILLLRRRC